MKSNNEIAVFGGGCFWCTEAIFSKLKGVHSVVSGYAGGTMENPGYHEVSSGNTGHAEVVRILFDPKIISYKILLDIFFNFHNPTSLNRQGADVGSQYRSIILYTTEMQQLEAEKTIMDLTESKTYSVPIVTEIKPLAEFYSAEEYHQKYYEKDPSQAYCSVVISPKLNKLKEKFKYLLK